MPAWKLLKHLKENIKKYIYHNSLNNLCLQAIWIIYNCQCLKAFSLTLTLLCLQFCSKIIKPWPFLSWFLLEYDIEMYLKFERLCLQQNSCLHTPCEFLVFWWIRTWSNGEVFWFPQFFVELGLWHSDRVYWILLYLYFIMCH